MQPEGNVQSTTPVAPQAETGAGAPVNNEGGAPVNEPSKDEIVFSNAPKKSNGLVLGMVLCAVLALGGIGFGVWAMMDGNQQKEQLNSQISTLKTQNSELQAKIENGSIDDCILVEDEDGGVSAVVKTEDYIYVGKWGLKFKIPESLHRVQYSFTDNYISGLKFSVESLCVSGISGADGLYEFNNLVDGAYVCISQNVGSGAGISNADYNNAQFPEGEFYVEVPQAVYSTDEAVQKIEIESVQVIRDWLSDANARSEI